MNFKKYSDEKLRLWLETYESLEVTRTLYTISDYVEARKETYSRWQDNSCLYIKFFTARPNATSIEFDSWFESL